MKQRPMYNEDQKMAFINDYSDSINTMQRAISIFRNTAPYEEKCGKDLAAIPKEELLPILENVCGVRIRSKYTRMSTIRAYMKWCVEHNVADAYILGEVDYSEHTESIYNTLMRSPEHLQQCLNRVFDPESEETQDNAYRCFLWFAYGGMVEQTAFSLNTDDISFEYMEATKGDEVAILYRQAIPAVRNCVKLTQFLYKNAAYVNGPIYRNRVEGTQLLRGIRESQSLINFRTQLSKKLKKKKEEGVCVDGLSYKKLYLSGVFYRIYEAEQAGIHVNFEMVAKTSPGFGGTWKDTARELQKDYIRWKTVVTSI